MGFSTGTNGNLVGTSGSPIASGLAVFLVNNGGPTLTLALSGTSGANSPAGGSFIVLDYLGNDVTLTNQAGISRSVTDDIGAL
jgi:hypothetical protein